MPVFFRKNLQSAFCLLNPLADNRLSFSVSGPGRIVAVGNGNPRAMESFADTSAHSLFFGKTVVVVRREGDGRMLLTATANVLQSAISKE